MSRNILYLTLSEINLSEEGIYSDLINELAECGYHVTVVQADSAQKVPKMLEEKDNKIRILRVFVGEIFRVNFIKKGINTLRIEPCFKRAIQKYLKNEKFDMILYATPPVTFSGVVAYCRKKFGCMSYLMLKDIFPQNAVDIRLFASGGLLHRFFQWKEKKLYQVSDMIGCMSQANLNYICNHNPQISREKIELFPNTINIKKLDEVIESASITQIEEIRKGFNIPVDRTVFVFGGNLGRPQAISYLLRVVKRLEDYPRAYFLFVGNGSEKSKVEKQLKDSPNGAFIDFVPPEEYHMLMHACDVGILSLDVRFTIPNYPSRILSYMAMSKPILACTDRNTDIRQLVESQAQCGFWNASDDENAFMSRVRSLCEDEELRMQCGDNGRLYLEQNFDVKYSVELIEKAISRKDKKNV